MSENPYEASQATPLKRGESNRHSRTQGMSPREVFGIVVRTLGLITILYGCLSVVGMLFPNQPYTPAEYLIGYGPIAVAGVIVFFGADTVVSLAYGTRYMKYDGDDLREDQRNDGGEE